MAYGNSLGYRKLSDHLRDDYGISLCRRTVLKLAKEEKALSAVRRKHFSEKYYLTRRQMKDNATLDLIGRNFYRWSHLQDLFMILHISLDTMKHGI